MTDSIKVSRWLDKVPRDLQNQDEIRNWLDDNARFFAPEVRGDLSGTIAERRGDGGGGEEGPPSIVDPDVYYDPGVGQWRDRSGSFSRDPNK